MKCWSCQAPAGDGLFCPACGKIAPRAKDGTHFAVFGLPARFDLDLPALEQRYRELSLKLHPDRFTHAEPKERRYSLEQTTALNEAYKTLKDPEKRAFYLLKLAGVDLQREDLGAQKDMPLEFLEEVMELREELHQAKLERDLEKAQAMGADVAKRRKEALAAGAEALDRHAQSGSEDALKEASHQLARVRYFTRFLEEVSAIEEEALQP